MTRLLIAYDASEAARAAVAAGAALFPGAQAVVANIHPPPPTLESAAVARIALPDSVIRVGIERLREEAEVSARKTADEGAAEARARGLKATAAVLWSLSTWCTLRDEARRREADVVVCGTRGEGPVDRVLLGSTATSLLYHSELPLLVVPAGHANPNGPVLAGFHGSEGARDALRFAAVHLRGRRHVICHAWRSPVRHSLRGRALAHSGVDVFEDYATGADSVWGEVAQAVAEDGTAFARELGLTAEASMPESDRGDWRTLVQEARAVHAAGVLVGSRGRGPVAATVLGSVTSGLVHAAVLPVLVVPGATASRAGAPPPQTAGTYGSTRRPASTRDVQHARWIRPTRSCSRRSAPRRPPGSDAQPARGPARRPLRA